MDLEKQDKPLFEIDEKRLENLLKEMSEEAKREFKNLKKSNAGLAIVFMIVIAAFCSERPECDDKEKQL